MRNFLSGHSSSELMGDVGECLLNPGGGGFVVEVGLICEKNALRLFRYDWNEVDGTDVDLGLGGDVSMVCSCSGSVDSAFLAVELCI